MLANHIQKYFWDIDTKSARPKSHPTYYISRILEMGDDRAFDWLKRVYGVKVIKRTLSKTRLSKKSENYWKNYFKNHG